jgi:tRNA-splicing ligase RtcB
MSEKARVNGHDLIQIGLRPGKEFGAALEFANSELGKGRSWEDVHVETLQLFSRRETPKMGLKPALPITVAAKPESDEEERNLADALGKIAELSKVPVVESAALMPDHCPSGQEWGCIPVGGAITTSNSIIPAAHSADINCGMHATFFQCNHSVRELMGMLQASTLFGPYGMPEGEEVHHAVLQESVWSNPFLQGLEDHALRYLGTQGDGNHFSYLGTLTVQNSLILSLEKSGHQRQARAFAKHRGETLQVLVTHHGSRNFGAKVYRRGLDAAVRYTSEIAHQIPKSGAWLDLTTPEGSQYWEALEYVSRWTSANHEVIHEKFLQKTGGSAITSIANHHNAVWRHRGRVYHGKGATPAWHDEHGRPRLGIIPLNMGREILLVEGLDNPQFLSFAPHGAGRNQSRTTIKRQFINAETQEDDHAAIQQAIRQQTTGILIEWASGKPDISESPLGYKSASKVKQEIADFGLARIIGEISPQGCIMAGELDPPWKRKRKKATP